MDYGKKSLELHEKHRGKMGIVSNVPVEKKEDLSIAYTPGVAEPCRAIAANLDKVWDLTIKSHTVAVVTDGTAVLGLGNIGPEAGLPVMEGKCILYKRFSGLDAFPICLRTKSPEEIIETCLRLAPTFGAIQLEDIKAPECFEVVSRLEKELDIPVMQDDQYGTAVVVLAGLINALKVVGKEIGDIKVVVNGAGSAGIAIADLLMDAGVTKIKVADSKGVLFDDGKRNLYKIEMAKRTNPENVESTMKEELNGADVFVGVSVGGVLTSDDVGTMAEKSIVMAMANPTPEIFPDDAKAGGAAVVATGRSDFPNQANNVLAYPGLFLGVLECRSPKFTKDMYMRAAHVLAGMVDNPTADRIFPTLFDGDSARTVANAVKSC
ncbi:MAG: NAD-dependent malic enzyme [Parcubacteria group bacterium]|nr:NAD-dependent malic enzyme [Parcubacteria group bacterium]